MAKNNNLTDFLTDVGDAIRDVKGKTNLINPQDFSDEIRSIGGTGGNGDDENLHKVTFIDYDGTELKVQFVKTGMSATPPAVPTHEYMVFTEWIGEYTNVTFDTLVGAHYNSVYDDRILLHHDGSEYASIYGNFNANDIDWGDGYTNKNSGAYTYKHRYTDNQEHWITLQHIPAAEVRVQAGIDVVILSNDYRLWDNTTFNFSTGLKSIVIPNGIATIPSAFLAYCYTLEAIVLPSTVTEVGMNAFYEDYGLKYAVMPSVIAFDTGGKQFWYCYGLIGVNIDNVSTFGKNTFIDCHSLRCIRFSNELTEIKTGTCLRNYSLRSVKLPNTIQTIGTSAFEQCFTLRSITITGDNRHYLAIGSMAFYKCWGLENIKITGGYDLRIYEQAFMYANATVIILPSNTTNIGDNAFGDVKCGYIQIESTTPPTLSNYNAFYSGYQPIFVPDSAISAYKSASNWSNFANTIYGISEKETILKTYEL